jgi:hypothetical protein
VTASHTGDNIGWTGGFPHMKAFAEFFFAQFAVFGPITFGIFLAAVVRLPLEGSSRAQMFLLSFSVPILAVVCFQALMSKAYANWAAVSYIAATLLVADLMVNTIPEFWRRLSLSIHLGTFAVIAMAVMFSRPGQLPLPENVKPFDRMHGAREIAAAAHEQLAAREFAAVLTDDRRISALMNYYLRDSALPMLAWRSKETPTDHFELTRPFQDTPQTPVLYITTNRNPAAIVQEFGDAEFLGQFEPGAGERKTVWFYELNGYNPESPDGDPASK